MVQDGGTTLPSERPPVEVLLGPFERRQRKDQNLPSYSLFLVSFVSSDVLRRSGVRGFLYPVFVNFRCRTE